MERESGTKLENSDPIATKVNTRLTRKMGMAFSIGRVAICTKVITKTMSVMSMVKCTGWMGLVIKENGSMEFNMDKEK